MQVSGKLEDVPLLNVIQVLAHSRQSGVLTVEADSTKGTVIFLEGNIVCAHSTSTLGLLGKAAKEKDPRRQTTFRRIQALVALAELLGLKEGAFRLKRTDEVVRDLDGIEMSAFYAARPMNTGDLLLVLARTVDHSGAQPIPAPSKPPPETQRRHPRFGPTVIRAELSDASSTVPGYLTNVSLGGVFFHGEELPEEGSLCELRFTLPDELGLCDATAKVVWIQNENQGATRGVGLEFEQIPAESIAKLSEFLQRFRQLAAEMGPES